MPELNGPRRPEVLEAAARAAWEAARGARPTDDPTPRPAWESLNHVHRAWLASLTAEAVDTALSLMEDPA